ncbi:MAG: hypothetical protein AAFN30_08105, partial [Actinomycetota bacterium]
MAKWTGLTGAAVVAAIALLAGVFVTVGDQERPEPTVVPQTAGDAAPATAPADSVEASVPSAPTSSNSAAAVVEGAIPAEALVTGPSPSGAVELSAEGEAALTGLDA